MSTQGQSLTDLSSPQNPPKLRTHHRRTQSSSVYDFKCILNASEPEHANEMIETHKVLNSDATSKAVHAATLKQKEKQLIVDNLDEVPISRAIVPKSKVGNPINYVKKRNISLGSASLTSCPVRKVELKTDYNSINTLTGLNVIFERKNSVESGCEIDTLDGKSDQKSISSAGTRTRTNSLGSPTFCERKGANGPNIQSPKHSPQNSITLSIQQSESPSKSKTLHNWFSLKQSTNFSPSNDNKFKQLTLDTQSLHKRTSSHNTPQNGFLRTSPSHFSSLHQQHSGTSSYKLAERTPLSSSKKLPEKKDVHTTPFKEPLKSITPTGASSKKHFVFNSINKLNTNASSLTDLHAKIIASKTTKNSGVSTEKESTEILSKLNWSYSPTGIKRTIESTHRESVHQKESSQINNNTQPNIEQDIPSPVKVDKKIEELQGQVQTLNGRTVELEGTVREFKTIIEKLMVQNKELVNTTVEQSKAIKLLEEEISLREQARLMRTSGFLRTNYDQGDNTHTMFLHSSDSSTTESPFTDGSNNPSSERKHIATVPKKGFTSSGQKEQTTTTSKTTFDNSKPVDKLIAQYKTALKKAGGRYNGKK